MSTSQYLGLLAMACWIASYFAMPDVKRGDQRELAVVAVMIGVAAIVSALLDVFT